IHVSRRPADLLKMCGETSKLPCRALVELQHHEPGKQLCDALAFHLRVSRSFNANVELGRIDTSRAERRSGAKQRFNRSGHNRSATRAEQVDEDGRVKTGHASGSPARASS